MLNYFDENVIAIVGFEKKTEKPTQINEDVNSLLLKMKRVDTEAKKEKRKAKQKKVIEKLKNPLTRQQIQQKLIRHILRKTYNYSDLNRELSEDKRICAFVERCKGY